MDIVNVHEAKTHLSRLLERVAGGDEVVIAKNGRPIARLVPIKTQQPRLPGRLKGRIKLSPGFEAPLPANITEGFGEK